MPEGIRAGGELHGAAVRFADCLGILIAMVAFPDSISEADLFKIIDALNSGVVRFGFGESRHYHRGQNTNNCQNHQEIKQCHGTIPLSGKENLHKLRAKYWHLDAVGGQAGIRDCVLQAENAHLLHAAVGESYIADFIVHLGGPACEVVGGEFK